MGDPAGIGGELTLKAWAALRGGGPAFAVLDDPARLRAIDDSVPLQPISKIEEADGVFAGALPVLATPLATPPTPGQPDPANAGAVLASIEEAVRMAQSARARAVVTNPISKATLYQAGFPHPGHTEFLAALTGAAHPVMMLANHHLRVVPVTVHVGLRAALDMLSTDMIATVARITAHSLRAQFGISRPRLALAGLNPHAGEGGAMGHEEETIIEPAKRQLRRDGIDVSGPYPPDTMFTPAARSGYDAAICMYHDQALIPLKTLDMATGVNVTLGLPIIRTSPDHGTAFDIAGQNRADASSLIAALRMADQMGRQR
ncbi:MAG: 4-hydroxythreonine-4-phosphate dehydrogenase PdxA [Bradyrhizobium sp.]|uniref:4-hydroxythreonine-4-phosphate dehydrogenase PdxA n=1 Tax=Bradyrhizobium sp. TaxID=376 RepID=UPI001E03F2EC|nr:4-hydroxythreonine-4-phosphate dehydrogenase PdxA [Bradyrhizobium sp.]MBV9561655.1 4-hydroxythreonine-4-phosphate dehydrogenase PdxA [Bradyrhizobium sp.]